MLHDKHRQKFIGTHSSILGREKIVKMLLKNDAEVEISAKDGDTAIAAAQSKGKLISNNLKTNFFWHFYFQVLLGLYRCWKQYQGQLKEVTKPVKLTVNMANNWTFLSNLACKSFDTLPVERIVGGELAEEEEFPFIVCSIKWKF